MNTGVQIFNYNGSNITMKKDSGIVYVNLTEIAKAFPEKNLSKIVNSQEISDYVQRLTEITNVLSADLLRIIKGGDPKEQGTWAHQKVALRVCQKLSTDFAIWVDGQIEKFLTVGLSLDSITRKDLAKMLLESEEEKERLQITVNEQAPKVKYHDLVLSSDNLMSITEIAKNYGMSAVSLNEILRVCGVQYKRGKHWIVTAKYQDRDYMRSVPVIQYTRDGKQLIINQMKWTEQGRKFIHELLAQKELIARHKRLMM
jgi:phage antirepressor YoqD-like protein